MTTTKVADGVYQVSKMGSCLEVAIIRNGRVAWQANEADLGTLQACGDSRAEYFDGLSEDGPFLGDDDAAAFVALYCPDCDLDCVTVQPFPKD